MQSLQKVRLFDQDGQLGGGEKLRNCLFINFSRLLVKDEIKKGSFSLQYYGSGSWGSPAGLVTIQDTNAQNEYRVNSPAGEMLYDRLYFRVRGIDLQFASEHTIRTLDIKESCEADLSVIHLLMTYGVSAVRSEIESVS